MSSGREHGEGEGGGHSIWGELAHIAHTITEPFHIAELINAGSAVPGVLNTARALGQHSSLLHTAEEAAHVAGHGGGIFGELGEVLGPAGQVLAGGTSILKGASAVDHFRREGVESREGWNDAGGAALAGAHAILPFFGPYGEVANLALTGAELGTDALGKGAGWAFGKEAGFSAESVAGGLLRGTIGDQSLGWRAGGAVEDLLGGGTGAHIAGAVTAGLTNAAALPLNIGMAAGRGIWNEGTAIFDSIREGRGALGSFLHDMPNPLAGPMNVARDMMSGDSIWGGMARAFGAGAHQAGGAISGQEGQAPGLMPVISGVGRGIGTAAGGVLDAARTVGGDVAGGLGGLGRMGGSIGTGIMAGGSEAFGGIMAGLRQAGGAISGQEGQAPGLMPVLSGIGGGVMTGLRGIGSGIGTGISTIGHEIAGGASDVVHAGANLASHLGITQAVTGIGQRAGSAIGHGVDAVSGGARQAAGGIMGGLSSAWGGISGGAHSAWDAITGHGEGQRAGIMPVVSGIGGGISQAVSGIGSGISSAASGVVSGVGSAVSGGLRAAGELLTSW